jgi:molecular chaperone GrpE
MPERTKPEPGDRSTSANHAGQAGSAVLDDASLKEIESLRQQVATAQQQRDEYLAMLRRTQADFDNFQKRNQREMADERRYALGPFARELLLPLDNLQRTLKAARQENEQDPLVEGVNVVESQLLDVFRRFGIVPIEAQDQPFDPTLHEAVLQRPRSDVSPGTVLEIFEPGYRLHQRVLRPARVAVAAPSNS